MLFVPVLQPSSCKRFDQRMRAGAWWLFLFISLLVAPSLRLVHHTLHSPEASNAQIHRAVLAEHDGVSVLAEVSAWDGRDTNTHEHVLFGAHDANDCLLLDQLLTGHAFSMWTYLPLAFAAMVAMCGWQLDLCTKAAPGHFDARGPPIFF